jgi:hypothetical protein
LLQATLGSRSLADYFSALIGTPCREQLQHKEAQRKQLQQALRRSQLAAKALRRLRDQLTSLEAGRNPALLTKSSTGVGTGEAGLRLHADEVLFLSMNNQ